MKSGMRVRGAICASLLLALFVASVLPPAVAEAQSGRQPAKKDVEKKTDELKKKGQEANPENQEPLPPVPKNQKDEPALKLSTEVVNCEVTVIDKKSGRLITGLSKKNFAIYEDGVKQEITNFSTGEG